MVSSFLQHPFSAVPVSVPWVYFRHSKHGLHRTHQVDCGHHLLSFRAFFHLLLPPIRERNCLCVHRSLAVICKRGAQVCGPVHTETSPSKQRRPKTHGYLKRPYWVLLRGLSEPPGKLCRFHWSTNLKPIQYYLDYCSFYDTSWNQAVLSHSTLFSFFS